MKITPTLDVLEKCSPDIIGPLSQTSDGDRYVNVSGHTLHVRVSYTNTATRHCNSSYGCCRSSCCKIWDSSDDINRQILAQQFASKDLISNFLFSILVTIVNISFLNFSGLWVSLDA